MMFFPRRRGAEKLEKTKQKKPSKKKAKISKDLAAALDRSTMKDDYFMEAQPEEISEVDRILRAPHFFEVLEVDEKEDLDKDSTVLRQNYLRKCMQLSPNVCDHPKLTEAFEKLSQAYDTLSDPELRTEHRYDHFGGRPELQSFLHNFFGQAFGLPNGLPAEMVQLPPTQEQAPPPVRQQGGGPGLDDFLRNFMDQPVAPQAQPRTQRNENTGLGGILRALSARGRNHATTETNNPPPQGREADRPPPTTGLQPRGGRQPGGGDVLDGDDLLRGLLGLPLLDGGDAREEEEGEEDDLDLTDPAALMFMHMMGLDPPQRAAPPAARRPQHNEERQQGDGQPRNETNQVRRGSGVTPAAGMSLGQLLFGGNLSLRGPGGARLMLPGGARRPATDAPNATRRERQNPRELYAEELRTLAGMGFNNDGRNLRALVAAEGNVEEAVNLLLGA